MERKMIKRVIAVIICLGLLLGMIPVLPAEAAAIPTGGMYVHADGTINADVGDWSTNIAYFENTSVDSVTYNTSTKVLAISNANFGNFSVYGSHV